MSGASAIECMLLRWSESHNGRTVTLQLPPEGDHPFRGLKCGPANGQRLAIAVVLINDDESTAPVEPAFQPSEKPASGRNGGGASSHRLAQQAGRACADVRFRAFLVAMWLNTAQSPIVAPPDMDAEAAAEFVRRWCKVQSRSELDTDPGAAERWNALYAEYLAETG